MAEITERNTKTEILKAYNEMLKKIKEEKTADRKAEKKQKEEQEIVTQAQQTSSDDIINRLASVKIDITKSMEDVEDKLTSEYKRFSELQQAVTIARKNLEEIHEISVQADSLTALIQAHKEEKTEFEVKIEEEKRAFNEEMRQKRLLWKKDQEETDLAVKERKARIEKERKQEEEDYTYNLNKKRKMEEDVYQTKKSNLERELKEKKDQFEREIAEREKTIIERESEYQELKTRSEKFPKELEKAIADTEKRVRDSLEISYKHQAALLTKEVEGERKLNQQIIASLEAKIKEKDEHIRQLTQKVNDTGMQVQDIALKAIEGASRPTIIREVGEKGGESGKSENRGR